MKINKVITILFYINLINIVFLNAVEIPKKWPLKGVHTTLVDKLPFTEKELYFLTQNGVNIIPITLQTRILSRKNKQSVESSLKQQFKQVHILLKWCKKYNCQLIITQNRFPLDPNSKIRGSSQKFWESKQCIDEVIQYANIVSKEFKNTGDELLAYKIVSEPVVFSDKRPYTPHQWSNVFKKILITIRNNDRKRFVFYTTGPGGTGNDYKKLQPLKDNRILYGFHFYKPHPYTHQGIKNRQSGLKYPSKINHKDWNFEQLENSIESIISFQKKYKVPIFVAEFSVVHGAPGQYKYLEDVLKLFEKYNFGWSYFNFNGYKGWNINYEKEHLNSLYNVVETNNSKRLKLLFKYMKKDSFNEK